MAGQPLPEVTEEYEEPQAVNYWKTYPEASSFSPRLPSSKALVQGCLQGNQIQERGSPASRIKALRARTHRTEDTAVGILATPPLSATVPKGSLWPGTEVWIPALWDTSSTPSLKCPTHARPQS